MRKDASTKDLGDVLASHLESEVLTFTEIDEALHSAWVRGFREGCRHLRRQYFRRPKSLEEARLLFGDSLLLNMVYQHLKNFAPSPEPPSDD